MIYLIGGAPRVGKTQFATRLVAAKPMPSLSLDFLYNLQQVRDIPEFGGASILDKGRLFYPTLKDLLVDVRRRSKDCVLDGEVILPEFIPELSEQYDIRSCFLGLSATNLETILEHGGYFNWPKWKLENGFEDEVRDLAERTVSRSLIIEKESKKYNLPYFDLANNYSRTSEAALSQLLS
jgi:hypothetical protein